MKYISMIALSIVAGVLPGFAQDTVPYAYRPPTAGDTYVPTLGDIMGATQFAAERDDGFDHRLGISAGEGEPGHEALVNLDFVEREPPKIAEARIAGPEVVHHDRDADCLDHPQFFHDGFAVIKQQAFGDLQFKTIGV
jgi:hypothetical protein